MRVKLDAFSVTEQAPFGMGIEDKSYPMWPCGRCDGVYVGQETKVHEGCCEEKHVEVENK